MSAPTRVLRRLKVYTRALQSVCLLFVVGGVDPDQKFIDVRMKAIRRKIVVLSGKGG